MDSPPETDQRDTGYTLHDDYIDDPYLWLEETDGDVSAWTAAQNDYADDYLGSLDIRESLRPRFEDLARTTTYMPVKARQNGYFQRVRDADADHPVLTFRPGLNEDRRVLVDPNEMSDDGSVSVDWYVPNPDGSLVAYGVAEGGDEQYDVRVLETESGETVEELIDVGRTGPWCFGWTDDGFYYLTTGSVGDGGQLEKEVRFHEIGTDPADDWTLADEFSTQTWPLVETDAESDYVILGHTEGWERTDLYYAELGSDELHSLVVGEDALFEPTLDGNDVYVNTSLDASNYRVVSVSLDAMDSNTSSTDVGGSSTDVGGSSTDPNTPFETVVAERDDAIAQELDVIGDRIVVKYLRDAVHELVVFDADGEQDETVPLPGRGSVASFGGEDDLFFTYESFTEPPSIRRYAFGADETTVVDQPDISTETDLTVTQEWFASADGTEVPAFVVRRSNLECDGDNPAVLYGYGGFENSLTPFFGEFFLPFLESGGVLAVANLRGGGEFGESWHHAGRREHKQRVFDDFFAAAEHLVENGYTSTERLACFGGSNGGLLVGASITQRPDLFAAAVCKVPLLDMLRFHTSLLGETWTTEYGSPDDPEAYEYIREYSPYHNVEERAYPAVLFTTGERDSRVDPFHARKMAARMQAAQSGADPILLKTRSQTGHGSGKPVSKVVEEKLDEWSFLGDQLDAF
ncbi:S9 family peptidase [Halogeometricum borinquense]|uniref:prolyl oligopeptidase n=1 Tax=Halogeometricum borinquense TaxID=60847 RepID=A0A6C0UGK7_9EURY|nr:prolyl oligopeptidase family serine peptidase [Halogeometricum borinquense]QIB74626.1 S9 family peptidase [Halogeometricum borinquense]